MLPGDRTNPIRDQPPAGIALDALPGREQTLPRRRALRQRHPQRLRVELVRMEVQHRVGVGGADLPEGFPQERRRQRAPVGAAADRHRAASDPPDGDRVLPDLAVGAELETVRRGRHGPDAPGDARRVVLARVVAEAEAGEDVVGPRRVPRDREGGSAVAQRPLAGELLEEAGAALDVGAELVPALGRDTAMRIAVAGELVALRGDALHEIGVALGGHPEDEERRFRSPARRAGRGSQPSGAPVRGRGNPSPLGPGRGGRAGASPRSRSSTGAWPLPEL